MRYLVSENPYIICRFTTADNVTITVYDLSDNLKVVDAVNMSEIESTGYFKYQFNPSPTALTEYLYIASNGAEEHAGKVILGGYPDDINDRINNIPVNPLLTNDIRLGHIDADISSRAYENPPSQNLDDYKAAGFSVPGEYDDILNDLHDEAFGKWILDSINNTLTLYRTNGGVLKAFDLTSTTEDVPSYIERIPQ